MLEEDTQRWAGELGLLKGRRGGVGPQKQEVTPGLSLATPAQDPCSVFPLKTPRRSLLLIGAGWTRALNARLQTHGAPTARGKSQACTRELLHLVTDFCIVLRKRPLFAASGQFKKPPGKKGENRGEGKRPWVALPSPRRPVPRVGRGS